jgi:hypothetical protein
LRIAYDAVFAANLRCWGKLGDNRSVISKGKPSRWLHMIEVFPAWGEEPIKIAIMPGSSP